MLGSAEIFSKPVTNYILDFEWENLPPFDSSKDSVYDMFSKYYYQYNEFLKKAYQLPQQQNSSNNNIEVERREQEKNTLSHFCKKANS